MSHRTIYTAIIIIIMFTAAPTISGVEPSPFKSNATQRRGDVIKRRGDLQLTANLLLPAIQDFKDEITRARSKVNRFVVEKGKSLQPSLTLKIPSRR